MKPFCFSLSGIYESEGYAWEQAGKIWDLRELRGTDGYLDPETEQFLEAELGRKKETKELPRIRLLDSGNYHYMSKLLLGLEKEDLFLAVFDHHTDMQPPALLPVLSCGSWIRDAAGAYQNIKGICVIGPPEASVRETEAMEHVWFVTQEELEDGSGAAKIKEIFASHAGTFPVYLSVDKDILSRRSLIRTGIREMCVWMSCCPLQRTVLRGERCSRSISAESRRRTRRRRSAARQVW